MNDLDLATIQKENLSWKDCALEIYGKNNKSAVDIASTILTTQHAFKTMLDNEETWYYENGCYYPNGENIIKKILQQQEPLQSIISNHFVNEVIASVKRKSFIKREEFDAPQNLICLKNGVYDLNQDKLIDHSPEYLFKNQIQINYVPGADCPAIKQFFKDIVEEKNYLTLFEISAYLLYRDYFYQKAIMLNGTNDNGKSKYIGLLETFIGQKNFSSEELQNICHSTFSKAELFGKLMNSCADLPATIMENTGDFKKLTSGSDTISAQRKFGHPFQYKNYAKLIFSANEVPESKDTTDAFFKRWIIIDFPYKFVLGLEKPEGNLKPADTNILVKITTKEELEGLLMKSICILKDLIVRGSFIANPSVDEVKQRYLLKSNSAVVFLETEITDMAPEGMKDTDYDCFVPKDYLWTEYLEYCKDKRTTAKSPTAFYKEIKEKWGAYTEKKTIDLGVRKNCFIGVRYLAKWRNSGL